MRAVFIRILAFVILIDLFYMGIGRLYLVQSEEHPPPELQITVETDTDTLVGMGETLLETKGGCLLCHKITEQGNTRGPDLRGVAGRAATRKPGLSAEAYLMESLVDPGAYVVAEFATANLWIAKDGAAHTPAINGTFLNGVTRQRIAKLLQKAGTPVHERTITWDEVLDADEVFSTGNLHKVVPITRIEDRDLQPGPIYSKARELYWEFAHGG